MTSLKVSYAVLDGNPDDGKSFHCIGNAIEHAKNLAEEEGVEQYVYQLMCIVPPREKL